MIPGILFAGSPGNMRERERERDRGEEGDGGERVAGIISALIILPSV